MIMKTKHAKNTGQMVKRGNWKITRGGQRGKTLLKGGHSPFCPIAKSAPESVRIDTVTNWPQHLLVGKISKIRYNFFMEFSNTFRTVYQCICSGKVKLVNSINPLAFRFTFTIIDKRSIMLSNTNP